MLVAWTAWADVAWPRFVPARNRSAAVWALVAIVVGSTLFMGEANGAWSRSL